MISLVLYRKSYVKQTKQLASSLYLKCNQYFCKNRKINKTCFCNKHFKIGIQKYFGTIAAVAVQKKQYPSRMKQFGKHTIFIV